MSKKLKNKIDTKTVLPDGGRIVSCFPFNSMQVIFYDVHSSEIPDLYELRYRKNTDERYLRVFICRNGACEFTLDTKTAKLSAGQVMYDFAVGDNKKFHFTTDYFHGVEINIQLDSFDKESTLYRKVKPYIKTMSLPEEEMFQSDYKIFNYSSDTEKRLDVFMDSGFKGDKKTSIVAYLVILALCFGDDIKRIMSNTTESQTIIAKDIYDCLTYELGKKWTAQMFADKYRVSTTTINRYFKKVYGYGFKEYQKKVIMDNAAKMLTTTDASISDIASKVGFEDYRFFSRAFKKYYGVTPSEYRLNAKVNA